jgi:hypothetical protein
MQIQTRPYTGDQFFRPQAVTFTDNESQLALIMVVWGNADIAATSEQIFQQALRTSKAPPSYQRLVEGLTAVHQEMQKKENGSKWRSVLEIAAIQRLGSRLQWVIAGEFQLQIESSDQRFPIAQLAPGVLQSLQVCPLPLLGIGLDGTFELAQGEASFPEGARLLISVGSQTPETPHWEATIDFSL